MNKTSIGVVNSKDFQWHSELWFFKLPCVYSSLDSRHGARCDGLLHDAHVGWKIVHLSNILMTDSFMHVISIVTIHFFVIMMQLLGSLHYTVVSRASAHYWVSAHVPHFKGSM